MSTRWIVPMGALWIVAASAACTVESDDSNPFGTVTTPVTSAPPAGDSGDQDSGDSSSGSGGGMGSSGADGDTTDGGGSTGPAMTGPMMTTTGVTMGGSTDDGGPTGMQPNSGMYSPCLVAADCTELCITISDEMGTVLGGFCSGYPCINPAVDCDPSPGGTAVPACVGITINGVPDTACYLDCTGGGTCPPPMVCTPVDVGIDLCV